MPLPADGQEVQKGVVTVLRPTHGVVAGVAAVVPMKDAGPRLHELEVRLAHERRRAPREEGSSSGGRTTGVVTVDGSSIPRRTSRSIVIGRQLLPLLANLSEVVRRRLPEDAAVEVYAVLAGHYEAGVLSRFMYRVSLLHHDVFFTGTGTLRTLSVTGMGRGLS